MVYTETLLRFNFIITLKKNKGLHTVDIHKQFTVVFKLFVYVYESSGHLYVLYEDKQGYKAHIQQVNT